MSVEFIGSLPESLTRGLLVGKLLVGGLGVLVFLQVSYCARGLHLDGVTPRTKSKHIKSGTRRHQTCHFRKRPTSAQYAYIYIYMYIYIYTYINKDILLLLLLLLIWILLLLLLLLLLLMIIMITNMIILTVVVLYVDSSKTTNKIIHV